jgi:D-alanyl-D-alanine carboxypeptidase
VARLGQDAARLRTARPGHSEHQLGTAIDVTSPGWSGRFGDWAVESAEGAWMAEHAWRYGFVMSYPAGQQELTCFGYEPWHYRWIGREAAAAHRDSQMVLRDFLERFIVPPEPAE